uniref:Uncharacterized protein n=1 Tax=Plectus sambesii TaxID=2011161 RepID=A0A914VGZ6_9BILA
METKHLVAVGLWTCAVVGVTVLSTLAMMGTPTCVIDNPLEMADGQAEFMQKFHDSERKITVIRAAAANKCLILRNPAEVNTDGVALRISPKSYDHHLAVHMFGQSNIDNCLSMPVHEVEVVDGEIRDKRDANGTAAEPAAAAAAPAAAAPAAAASAKGPLPPGIEGTNQCQDRVLVDCGGNNAGVYDCVTGPKAVYRASTKCTGASQFVFSLQPRCDEFDDTKGLRFIKCLQHFIFGKHLKGGAAHPSRV